MNIKFITTFTLFVSFYITNLYSQLNFIKHHSYSNSQNITFKPTKITKGTNSYFGLASKYYDNFTDFTNFTNSSIRSFEYNLTRFNLDGTINRTQNISITDGSIANDLCYTKDINHEYIYVLESGLQFSNRLSGNKGESGRTLGVHKVIADNNIQFGNSIWSKNIYTSNQNIVNNNAQTPNQNNRRIIPFKNINNSDDGAVIVSILRNHQIPQTFSLDIFLQVTRINKDGNVIWNKLIKNNQLEVIDSSNFQISMNYEDIFITYSNIIIKIDASQGDIVDSKEINVITPLVSGMILDVYVENGEVIICGKIRRSQNWLFNKIHHSFTLCLDNDLNQKWGKIFSSYNNSSLLRKIVHSRDNEYFLLGRQEFNTPQEQFFYINLESNSNNSTLNYSKIVNTNNNFPSTKLQFVDATEDLSCGFIGIFNSDNLGVGSNINVGPDPNLLIRSNNGDVSCNTNNLIFDEIIDFNPIIEKHTIIEEEVQTEEYNHSQSKINTSYESESICESCSTQFNQPFAISVVGLGTVPTACVGATLQAPKCYAFYKWFLNNTLIATTTSNTYTTQAPGFYSVTSHYSDNCSDFSLPINIRPTPMPNFAFNDNCEGENSMFNVTSLNTNIVFSLWSFGDGNFMNNFNSANNIYSLPGKYVVNLKQINQWGCENSVNKVITIHEKPSIVFNETAQLTYYNQNMAICLSRTAEFTNFSFVNDNQNIIDNRWSIMDPNQNVVTINEVAPNHTFQTTGIHHVTLYAETDNGCKQTLTKDYNVYIPSVDFSHDNICEFDDVTLTSISSTQYGNIHWKYWYLNGNVFSPDDNIVLNNAEAGKYNFKFRVFDSQNCEASIEKEVEIFELPQVSFTNTTSCQNQVMTFNGTASSNNATITKYDWNFDDGNTDIGQTVHNNYQNAGSYNPSLKVTDSRGCMNELSKTVTVLSLPDVPVITNSLNKINICENETVTLTPTNIATGNSFVWVTDYQNYNNSSSSNITYTGGNSQSSNNFKIKVTDAITGCFNHSLHLVLNSLFIDNVISTGNQNLNICAGGTVQIDGTINLPQQDLQWQTSNDNGLTWNDIANENNTSYNATTSGLYRYKTSRFACEKLSNEIIINNAGNLTIDNTLIPNNEIYPLQSPALQQISTLNPPNYSNIKWYRNNELINTNFAHPLTLPGDYFCIANGCGIEKSNTININYEQANITWDQNTYVAGLQMNGGFLNISGFFGDGFLVGGDIELNNGAELVIEANLNFTGCYKIKVNAGCSLTITNNSVISSSTQWQGIVVDGDGYVLINNGADISNAIVGLISYNNAKVQIQNSKFGRNVCHLAFKNYARTLPLLVNNNKFGSLTDSTLATCYHEDYYNLGIQNGTNIFIDGNTNNHPINFNNNNAYLVEINDFNKKFLHAKNHKNINLTLNTITGFYDKGIHLENCENISLIGNTTQSLDKVFYAYNPTPKTGSGLVSKNTKNLTLNGNKFQYFENGVEFYENLANSPASTFTENKFLDNKFGLVVAPVLNPHNYSGNLNTNEYNNQIDLNIQCNLFNGNEVGLFGSGRMPLHRIGAFPFTSVGNRFVDNGTVLNNNHSIIWRANTSWYSARSSNPLRDDYPESNSPTTNYNIDGTNTNWTYVNSNIIQNATPQFSNNTCTPNLKRQLSVEGKVVSNITMYPNPTLHSINFEGLIGNNTISVYDVNGKLVLNHTTENPEETVDVSNLTEGVYFIKIMGKEPATFKLIKLSN